MAEETGTNSTTMSRASAVLNSPRSRRFGKWFGGFLLLFGLFGFFAAPPLVKSILLKQLSTELHREVSIESIDINPFALSARISGLSIKAEGGKELAGFDELFVNLSTFSVFQAGLVVDAIRLQGPRLAVARLSEGRYDISDLLDAWMKPKEEPESPLPRFSLNNIQVIGGKIEFDDQPKGKVHTIGNINLGLPFVSSLPYQAEVHIEPSFSAVINGAPLALKGRSKPFAGKHESELDLDLDRFDLAGFQPYLPDSVPLHLGAGTLDSELKIVFRELSEQVFSLAVVGSAHVSGLALAESGGQPLIGWKRLDVDLENADLINRKIAIKRITLDGLDATLTVNRQGEFNILMLADRLARPAAKAPTEKPAATSSPAKPLEWSLGEFVLTDGLLRWNDDSKLAPVVGEVRHLQAVVGRLDSKLVEPIEIGEVSYQVDLGERFRVEKMQIKGIRVDLPAHRIDIAEVSNSQTRARMLRNKTGQIEWVSSPVLKTIRATKEKVEDERPWVGAIAKLSIEDLAFRLEDQTTRPAAVQELEGFSLHGEHLGNEPGKKGTVSLKGKINKKGNLNVDGTVQIMPLSVALKVQTEAIPLMPLQPYFSEQLNIALSRGQFSNKGEATAVIDKGELKAGYKGSLTLGDFLAVDKINSADFLKWKSLYVGGVDFQLQPMTINVGEIALADFYSRLILNAAGRLNVQDIVKKPEGEVVVAPPAPTQGPTEASKTAAVKPPAKEAVAAKPVVPIKIAKITLQNGTVNFSDFFVKPNYTVNVTKLGGRISGLSSAADTLADLELRGSYANSAPVQIAGKLNPLAAKSFLDIKAEVTGVDLVGFSPYSGKYAGYAIEKGKLSLNLAYKLENNLLTADNRLFIDQFTFGDQIESPDATKLPVNLAISLLKNNRGEIDLNLPISGSLDDPEFSVGGLIFKVIGNLFVKAVTSPFALLGSMFGSGEELSNVEFAPGRAAINEAAGKKLEALAKALNERAALKLEITGRADPEADKEGIKRVAIERAMKAEKLKDTLKKSGEGDSLESIEIAPEEYKTYLTRAYKEAKFPKPRNMVGMQKELPVEEMEKLMLTNLPASDDDVRALAVRRAETVQGWLVESGKVPVERIFLLPAKIEADEKAKTSRVDFSLR
ncbi:hypothetical protein AT959_00705 [Dechloromonas denitrificans]|uniref:AsmA domain-containing protein n=1 Tax=Dechloromonas denitrificans TaxID=281362 RepID=A0A133XP99_9RHOO|nr:DUF748 domain-containing protein [Dechloromonas denitrificans]KXB32749.1 hypothetical protein AT959_00705 [Dechloromonas denitrificans]